MAVQDHPAAVDTNRVEQSRCGAQRREALRAWRRRATALGNWPAGEVIDALADAGWRPDDPDDLAARDHDGFGYYVMLALRISPDRTPSAVLTWAEYLVTPAITDAEASANMPLRPAGFGKALTGRVVADCAVTIRAWYDLLGPDLAPLAVAAGLTLDEARCRPPDGDLTPRMLEMLVAPASRGTSPDGLGDLGEPNRAVTQQRLQPACFERGRKA